MKLFLNMDDVNSAATPQRPDPPGQISNKRKSSKSDSIGKRRRPKKESELPRKRPKGDVLSVEDKHGDDDREADRQKEVEELYLMLSQTFNNSFNSKNCEAKTMKKGKKVKQKVIHPEDVEMVEIVEPSNKDPDPVHDVCTEESGRDTCKDGDDGGDVAGKGKGDGGSDGDGDGLIASYGSANVSHEEGHISATKDDEGNSDDKKDTGYNGGDKKDDDDEENDVDEDGGAYTIPPPPDPGEIPDLLSAFERDLSSNDPVDVDIFKLFRSWKMDGAKSDLDENEEEEDDNSQHDIDGNEGELLDVMVNKDGGSLPLEVRDAIKFIKIHDDDEDDEVQLLDDDPKNGRVSPIKNVINTPTFPHLHPAEFEVQTGSKGVKDTQGKMNHLSLKSFLDSSILEIQESDFKAWSQSCNRDNQKSECSTPVKVGDEPSTCMSPAEGFKDGNKDKRALGLCGFEDIKVMDRGSPKSQPSGSIVIVDDLFNSNHGNEINNDTNNDSDVIPSSPNPQNPNRKVNINSKKDNTNCFGRGTRDPDIVFASPNIESSRSIRRIKSMRVNFSRHFSSSTSILGFNSQLETNRQTSDWDDVDDFKILEPNDKDKIVIDDDEDDAGKLEDNFRSGLANIRTPFQKQLDAVSHLPSSPSVSYKPDFHTFLEEFERDFFSSDKDDSDEDGNDDPVVLHVVDPPTKPQLPQASRKGLNRLKEELADTSQVTYSQALECLEYSNIFAEKDLGKAETPVKVPSDSKNKSSLKSQPGITDPCGDKFTNIKPSVMEEILPGFDLNIDLDEWSDDEDLVPPSPPKLTRNPLTVLSQASLAIRRSDSNPADNFPLENNNMYPVHSSSPFKAPLSVAVSKTTLTTPGKPKFFSASRSPEWRSPGSEGGVPKRERLLGNMGLQDETPARLFTALKVPFVERPQKPTSISEEKALVEDIADTCDLVFDDDFVDDQMLGDFPMDELIAKNSKEGDEADKNDESPNKGRGSDRCQTSTPNMNFKKSTSLCSKQKICFSTCIINLCRLLIT